MKLGTTLAFTLSGFILNATGFDIAHDPRKVGKAPRHPCGGELIKHPDFYETQKVGKAAEM
jgi:hypothetical protein